MVEARLHLEFCARLYEIQASEGRPYLHEHPYYAESWAERSVQRFLRSPGSIFVESHVCRFGLELRHHGRRLPAKKPTGFLTNSVHIAQELNRKCQGDHEHIPIMGGNLSKQAQVYPKELCVAICRGGGQGVPDQGDGSSGRGDGGCVHRGGRSQFR